MATSAHIVVEESSVQDKKEILNDDSLLVDGSDDDEHQKKKKKDDDDDDGLNEISVNDPLCDRRTIDLLAELSQRTRSLSKQHLDGNGKEEISTNTIIDKLADQLEGLGNHKDRSTILDILIYQFLSEKALHEPMKIFSKKYPDWLEAKKSLLSELDHANYVKQYKYMKELCGVYESTPNDFQKVVSMLQLIQECGQPPSDLTQEVGQDVELGNVLTLNHENSSTNDSCNVK